MVPAIDMTWDQGTICVSNDGRLRLAHTFTVGTNAGNLQNCSGVTGQVVVLAGGKIDKTVGGTNFFSLPVHNQGTISIGDGRTISFSDLQNETGGLLTGVGTAAGTVTNAGGDVNPAAGTLTVGALTQSSGTTTVDGGDTLAVINAHAQSGGLTIVQATGVLSAASHRAVRRQHPRGRHVHRPDHADRRRGARRHRSGERQPHQTSGEVRPGRSPGTLGVSGSYRRARAAR